MTPTPNTDSTLQEAADLHRDLFLQVGHLHRRNLMNTLTAFNLTTGQYHALTTIAQHEPGCTMSDLAAATYHVLPTVTGIITRLEGRGLVDRRPDEMDRRTRRVYLTEDGQALLAQIDEQRQSQAIAILERFTPTDRHELLRLMRHYLTVVSTLEPDRTQSAED